MRLAQLMSTTQFGGTDVNAARLEFKEADVAHIESEQAR